jgi:hypothetical protein
VPRPAPRVIVFGGPNGAGKSLRALGISIFVTPI